MTATVNRTATRTYNTSEVLNEPLPVAVVSLEVSGTLQVKVHPSLETPQLVTVEAVLVLVILLLVVEV